ncbi:glycosyltransferase family 2 protein [Spirulina subsalsa FACHB-351]|uniref:Glycosyltransferase family 2 protein n=1 Tax=Spirulina subsalsa FACHB-351 TaxID=234711 RepID=A0ABT3L3B3_9CYAN|nr:glycosyltransferase family 2 protein [Spirulina subsalsa]MCW6035942.1 glycosyltransferase family 2 protein [Spirulina subsalsa FACHB-351]
MLQHQIPTDQWENNQSENLVVLSIDECNGNAEKQGTAHLGEFSNVTPDLRPLVSLIVPAYNEEAILEENLETLYQYTESLAELYRWEILVINDGSRDNTGFLAEQFACDKDNVFVYHHGVNFGLGQALQFGFHNCQGDYVIVFDLDLSYAPHHIGQLLDKITQTNARVVVASPYMKGGQISNVPWLRQTLSIWANRFLKVAAKDTLATLTGMVRVYDGPFLRSLNLRSMGMEINPEIIHKAMLLNARIIEIPAHLHWRTTSQPTPKKNRRQSSMKILKHTMSIVVSGFLFRPVMFFILPGLFFLFLSLIADSWVLIHCFNEFQNPELAQYWFGYRLSEAVANAFKLSPHSFILGGMTLMIAIQLISLGISSLQSKSYFEEVFYLGTAIYKSTQAKGK